MYRFELDEPDTLILRAWEADEHGHIIDKQNVLSTARFDEPIEVHGHWFDSRDTDTIHELPELARAAVFDVDDAIRSAFRTGLLTRASSRHHESAPSHPGRFKSARMWDQYQAREPVAGVDHGRREHTIRRAVSCTMYPLPEAPTRGAAALLTMRP
ncbi:hypothetical protein [Agromyces silvae]|uniref:hypothetical protein n=1 Tax=Agromyces silvae TaxID=3388266 RepID=UPI00280AB4FA|nr:hypothetical protein [Agromyces protaetiae]